MTKLQQLCSDIEHDLKMAYAAVRRAHSISTCATVESCLVEAMAKIDSVANRTGIDLVENDAML